MYGGNVEELKRVLKAAGGAILGVASGAIVLIIMFGLALEPDQPGGPARAVIVFLVLGGVATLLWAASKGLLRPWAAAYRRDSRLRLKTGTLLAVVAFDVWVLSRYGDQMLPVVSGAFHAFAVWAIKICITAYVIWAVVAVFIALFTWTAVYPRTRVITNRIGEPLIGPVLRFGLPVLLASIAVWGLVLMFGGLA